MMFDYDPTYNPPYYDASFEKLYDYFQDNHEYGELGERRALYSPVCLRFDLLPTTNSN